MNTQRFRTSDGLSLAFHVDDFTDPWAEPDTLLLLHSAMGESRRFYNWIPGLARRYRVARLDLRGHGESEVPGEDQELSMERLVADASELLDHLGWSATHVVGNSAGGYVGQNLAMASPDRVRSLVLFGSTPGLKHTQVSTWLPRVAKEGLRNFLADTIDDRFDLERTDPDLVDWFLDQAGGNDEAWIGRFIGLMSTLDWSDRLHEIRCPTLVVVPGAETVGSTRSYDAMRDRIPDVQVIEYPGMPHNVCDGAPARCVDDVLAFLRWRFG
jgi:3-oxoadipate enol-lactonase